MHGWFQKLFKSGTQNKNSKTDEKPAEGASVKSKSSSSEGTSVAKPQQLKTSLSSELRWRRKYDVFVCHSFAQKDTEEAERLVLFLETPPRSLRCFLWHRDSCPGGAISTEFCKALENSHIQALLITPSFVQDDWCSYMMHQTLAERPMSNTMIPLLLDLAHSQYPQELRFYYYIDLSKNPDNGFNVVNKTVQSYLKRLIQSEEELNHSLGDSSCASDRRDNTQESNLMSVQKPASRGVDLETSTPQERIQQRDKSIRDICCDQD
ncbi:toll/interleukin-1 receptor domain-containing adapter protein [Poeciliopsis prolifica]|uniref:toll/interleukin-1 receptor domain-containing adapter protein n=1 Tax=Poeciliopsis prolifica TaxID=188132 RepID=UPI0024132915|nr:toll/interleukin-1 receptor domain-containing adapter protein [Poeciliopsis prolifica]